MPCKARFIAVSSSREVKNKLTMTSKTTDPINNNRRYYYQIPINITLLAISILFTLMVQRHEHHIGGGIGRPLLFLLINLEIFIAILLAASIIRQSVTLFLDRYKDRPGSVFRKNLLFSFIFLSILPGIFIFLGASKLVVKHLELWLGARIEQGLASGLTAYQQTTHDVRTRLRKTGTIISDVTTTQAVTLPTNQDGFEVAWWPKKGKFFNLGNEIQQWRTFRELNDRPTKELRNELLQQFENQAQDHEAILDFYGSIYWLKKYPTGIVAVIHRPSPLLRSTLIKIQNAHADYSKVRGLRTLLKFNFYLQSILLLFLVLALAIWCAFHLARGISEPIQTLLEATNEIRAGNFLVHITPSGSRDLQALSISFNEMTKALAAAQTSLANKNKELIAVFEHLSASVFLYAPSGHLITCNQAAQDLCTNLTGSPLHIGKRFNNLPKSLKRTVHKMLSSFASGQRQVTQELELSFNGQQVILMLHLQQLDIAATPKRPPYLLVIEDLSNIVKINTLKTWQEAVKQIAHEIKNPLTPIQLTTQRLQRKCMPELPPHTAAIFNDGCSMILDQVNVIKQLVATFSSFAIPTQLTIEPSNIELLIDDVFKMFKLSYPHINFVKAIKTNDVMVSIDAEKIKRVLINLITNSIEAFKAANTTAPTISVELFAHQAGYTLTIHDNGPGIAPAVQDKLFLPYISTNKKNMGLGLAIVHEIISQHGGSINVATAKQGATFEIKLPRHQ
jgi:two-component system, NtrC family, nitrogen regulation sensor histidine kinase NtrY